MEAIPGDSLNLFEEGEVDTTGSFPILMELMGKILMDAGVISLFIGDVGIVLCGFYHQFYARAQKPHFSLFRFW